MHSIVQSLRRDHRDIEALLRVLEQECDLFRQAERADYDLLRETNNHFQSFLKQYYYPKEDLILNRISTCSVECARLVNDIMTERTTAISCLQDLGQALRAILNEQRVLRQAFDDAACGFIQHQRRQIALEAQELFPASLSVLAPVDWANLEATFRAQKASLRCRRLEEQLRAQQQRIVAEALEDQAARRESGRTIAD